MNLLQVENVSKQFEGHCALENISFNIKKGSIVGLIGHNGAGKTTLIRIITQITAGDKGQITLNGAQLGKQHANMIGYLPEERGLYKKMKVLEQLIYLGRLRGLSKNESTTRASKWLERLEISKWENHILADLSKGMQQKVQFIAAILHEPDFLILDEPFSGFDPVNADLLTKEILELNKSGMTILFSTHQMESIEELCEHVVMINKSKCVFTGSVRDLKNQHSANLIEIEGIGSPPDLEFKSLEKSSSGYLATIEKSVNESNLKFVNRHFSDYEIKSFKEKSPSMREIFLKIVNAE